MIDPKWLSLSIVGIVQSLIKEKHTQIMLDGKAIKSTDAIKSIEKMMNIVTAYTNTGISLLQKTVDNKTNEIPAVKELIDMLDVKGMIITADAMHCQKETAEKIVNNGGDYVLQLKANQRSFYEDVYAMFDDKYMDETDKNCEYEIYKTEEKSHGRIERRTCYVLNEIAFFTDVNTDLTMLATFLKADIILLITPDIIPHIKLNTDWIVFHIVVNTVLTTLKTVDHTVIQKFT